MTLAQLESSADWIQVVVAICCLIPLARSEASPYSQNLTLLYVIIILGLAGFAVGFIENHRLLRFVRRSPAALDREEDVNKFAFTYFVLVERV